MVSLQAMTVMIPALKILRSIALPPAAMDITGAIFP
jgi:hypothetical protein